MERFSLNGTNHGLPLRLLPKVSNNLLRHAHQLPDVNHQMEKD